MKRGIEVQIGRSPNLDKAMDVRRILTLIITYFLGKQKIAKELKEFFIEGAATLGLQFSDEIKRGHAPGSTTAISQHSIAIIIIYNLTVE